MRFEEAVDILRKNGIAGAGGAGFPSYAKLSKKAETIILNCAECEPLFKQHRQLLEKYAFEIVSMLDELAALIDAKEFVVAIKESYVQTVEAVNLWIKDFKRGRVVLLKEVYPAGDEVITVYEATGKKVPPGGIPIDVGVIVYNVETVFNIFKAVNLNEPVTHKYLTVAGCVENPMVLKVPIGMMFEDVVRLCGKKAAEDVVYISGGPMTGNIASGKDVVTKTTNGILVMPKEHYIVQRRMQKTSVSIKRAMSACCQCMTCTDLCPRYLLGYPVYPHGFMAAAAQRMGIKTQMMLDSVYCSSCGVCELYSCPQGLNPRSLITEYKKGLRESGIKIEKKSQWEKPHSLREYRMVPESRLIKRLGLSEYDVDAPLVEKDVKAAVLRVLMSQSLGAPSTPVVKKGQKVKKGELIGEAVEGALSLNVFSPADGVIQSVTDNCVVIKCDN